MGAPLKRLLDPAAASAFLKQVRGYQIAPSTLATKRSRGGGPPFRKWGRRILYDEDELLVWADTQLGPTVTNSSELHSLTIQRSRVRNVRPLQKIEDLGQRASKRQLPPSTEPPLDIEDSS